MVVKSINKFKASLEPKKEEKKEEPKQSDELKALNKIIEILEENNKK